MGPVKEIAHKIRQQMSHITKIFSCALLFAAISLSSPALATETPQQQPSANSQPRVHAPAERQETANVRPDRKIQRHVRIKRNGVTRLQHMRQIRRQQADN